MLVIVNQMEEDDVMLVLENIDEMHVGRNDG